MTTSSLCSSVPYIHRFPSFQRDLVELLDRHGGQKLVQNLLDRRYRRCAHPFVMFHSSVPPSQPPRKRAASGSRSSTHPETPLALSHPLSLCRWAGTSPSSLPRTCPLCPVSKALARKERVPHVRPPLSRSEDPDESNARRWEEGDTYVLREQGQGETI